MKNVGMALVSMVAGIASLVSVAADAAAQDRMIVLIDASGSMDVQRDDGTTRFEAAKTAAKAEVVALAGAPTLRVAVYTFSDVSSTVQTSTVDDPLGFVDPNDALDAIEALELYEVGGGSTPLAGSMCDAVSSLVNTVGTGKFLHVSSDGEENTTPMTHLCHGLPSETSLPPYTAGSWHRKVRDRVAGNVTLSVALFSFSVSGVASKRATRDPEAAASAARIALDGPRPADARPPSLAEFFGELSVTTGGKLTVVSDDAPLPVSGDLNGDRCVNRTDALLVARAFGPIGSVAESLFDINHDGLIGFADYSFVSSQIGAGCAIPPSDPYSVSGPVNCPKNGATVTIDGKAISSASFPIVGAQNCRFIIRNSLIIGGLDALSLAGNNRVTVDNSIIVGERSVMAVVGFTRLSAARTIFHGPKTEPDGAIEYVDRGGNVWEE